MDEIMKKIIISVFGPDRPGILAAVSRILFEQDCNIENVTQTILQSEFSGSFIAEMPAALTSDALCCFLSEALTPMRLQVNVKHLEISPPALGGKPAEPFVITTRGPDRKGLVANVTRIIAGYGVNVTNLQAAFKGGENGVSRCHGPTSSEDRAGHVHRSPCVSNGTVSHGPPRSA